MTTALLISTYNRPDALKLCLQSVQRQKVLPLEVVVADDGSGEATREMINAIQKDFPVPIRHVWHPDDGFRVATIRNKGIAATTADYIIQIDGDILMHPEFIADHLEMKKAGYFVVGSRVMLSEKDTEALLKKGSIPSSFFDRQKLAFNGMRNRFLRRMLGRLYKIEGRHRFYAKGCNIAFFRSDLLKVNGYNEAYTGWGSEDRDIAIRLMNASIKKLSIKMGAVCYHLYHTVNSRNNEIKNEGLMHEAINRKLVWAEKGLSQYL